MTLTNSPLTSEQRLLPSGAYLPSGEANFFDVSQAQVNNGGSGINVQYPSPSTFNTASGLYATYAPYDENNIQDRSGIYNYRNLSGIFSNAPQSLVSGITSFNIFNPYIHYYPATGSNVNGVQDHVSIPFTSDYEVSELFDIYSIDNYGYYVYTPIGIS